MRSWPHANSQQPEPQVLQLKARPLQDLAQGAVGLGEGAACEECGAEVCADYPPEYVRDGSARAETGYDPYPETPNPKPLTLNPTPSKTEAQ